MSTKANHRIILSNCGGSILLVEINQEGMLTPIWKKGAYKIPKTVAFSEKGDLIYVFGLWDGTMYVNAAENQTLNYSYATVVTPSKVPMASRFHQKT